jgi:choline dehydrogenase-like flavoprotein
MVLENIAGLSARAPEGARVVVIGSGAVGLYTATELARHGHNVVVVESGAAILDSFGPDAYTSIGRKHDGIRIGRSRSLGGTSNLWGGQLAEFQPVDLNGREWVPDSKWPVSYDELAPYYPRTYENLGIAEEAHEDAGVWRQLRTECPLLGEGLEVFLTRWLTTPSFAVAHARDIETSRNLLVLTKHTVVGFRAANDVITAVQVVDRTAATHLVEGDTFVVAAGTIETVRLLLHSATTAGWDCPWRDNAHLGSRFQDHLGGRIASVHPEDRRLFFDTFSNIVVGGRKYQPKLRFANTTLESDRILNIHGMFVFESSISENLVYLKQFVKAAIYSRQVSGMRDLFRNLRACSRYLVPIMWAYARDNRIFEPRTSKISLVTQGEPFPLSESTIGIDRSTYDATGLPKVVLDWKVSDHELESIREFALRSDRALRAARLAGLRIDEQLLDRDPRFMSTLRDTNHQAGGAVMGTSESNGVVDRDLRVFGTSNLYVAGAATFPTISGANTTFTALAFATRLVDHLGSERALR